MCIFPLHGAAWAESKLLLFAATRLADRESRRDKKDER